VSPASPETRGYPDRGIERQGRRPSQGLIELQERAVVPEVRREPKRSRGPVERQDGTGIRRGRTEQERIQTAPRRDNPFSGIGNGNFERKASERGGISRQREEIKRPGGDAGRKEGGAHEGGGGRGSGKDNRQR